MNEKIHDVYNQKVILVNAFIDYLN